METSQLARRSRGQGFRISVAGLLVLCLGFAGMAIGAAPALAHKLPPPEFSAKMPYPSQYVSVLGSKMHYVEAGRGDPILFLHGEPTSSYLWRNIMPYLETQGRVIAVDNIGFGKSDKPNITYDYANHMRYIDAFIEKLELKNITLVIHDWGSAMGFDYAERNRGNVKGIAFMEALMMPVLPAKNYASMGKMLEEFFLTMRSQKGTDLMVKQNYFVEGVLPSMINRDITKTEMAVYRAPFPDEHSRRVIPPWPNMIPIGGEPAHTTAVVNRYNAWLKQTDMPMIVTYVSPGALISPDTAQWLTTQIENLETAYVGQGFHYMQEDNPHAIGRAIADWHRRHFGR